MRSYLLADAGETASLATLVHRLGDPVYSGVAANLKYTIKQ